MKLGLYQHHKGQKYHVIGISRHSETLDELVVYRALYGEYGLWVRPLEMFTEKIVQNGKEVDRFQYLGPLSERAPNYRT